MKIKSIQFYVKCLFIFCSVCALTATQANDAEVVALPEINISNDFAKNIHNPGHSNSEFNRPFLDTVNRADLNGLLRGLPSTGLSQSNGNSASNIILRGAGGGLGLVNLDGISLFGNFTGFFPLSHYYFDLLNRVSVARGHDEAQSSSRKT